ncbi:hypothetical protein [Dictyobacter kobayashii]|nr:hypothetical protein [Dictyobacter kobayashii]
MPLEIAFRKAKREDEVIFPKRCKTVMKKKESGFRYLERYQEGQHRAVWDELVQLGPAVFDDQLHAEALAVTRAMMRRVRVNIETLIAKLLQCGFVFGYDVRLHEQLVHSLTSPQNRRQYQEMRDWVHEQPPVFLPAKQREEEIAETEQFLAQDPSLAIFVDVGELEQEKRRLQQTTCSIDILEQIVGPVPLAVRAWFEEVEAVNFFGYHPQWSKLVPSFHEMPSWKHIVSDSYLMSSCDPFQICALNEQKIASLKEKYLLNKACSFEFAPDRYFKDYCGGSSTPYTFG